MGLIWTETTVCEGPWHPELSILIPVTGLTYAINSVVISGVFRKQELRKLENYTFSNGSKIDI